MGGRRVLISHKDAIADGQGRDEAWLREVIVATLERSGKNLVMVMK
jgi:hypothetical protein